MRERTLAIILAGGKGSRLEPLTYARAKPAVPFGGSYRIIDFALSNCVNSELLQILVLTQYKSLSVDRHLDLGWKPLFPRELGTFLNVIPPACLELSYGATTTSLSPKRHHSKVPHSCSGDVGYHEM